MLQHMSKTLTKGAKVRVTNYLGKTVDTNGKHFSIIGQEGYVLDSDTEGWLYVILPEHRYFSTGSGILVRSDEVEIL